MAAVDDRYRGNHPGPEGPVGPDGRYDEACFEAVAAYRESLSGASEPAPAAYAEGRVWEMVLRQGEALTSFRRALETEGARPWPRLLNAVVRCARALGREVDTAVWLARRAVAEPPMPELGLWSGHLFRAAGELGRAVEVLSECVELVVEPAVRYPATRELLQSMLGLGRLVEAAALCGRAMSWFPEQAGDLQADRAGFLSGAGRHEEALDGGDVRGVPGLDGRIDGERFHTPDRPPVRDVAALPEPRIDDLDMSRYAYYTTVTARGCPYQCAFCEIPTMEQRRVRNRSVEAVVAELVRVHRDHGVDYVAFQDDIFLLSKRRVGAILEGLEREGVQMAWAGFARAGRVDRSWYASLRERGMVHVTFGIEAGADALLDRMAKGLTLEKAFSGIRDALHEVSVRCFFLWGFPYETLADFLGTAQAVFHAELFGATVEAGQVVPLPGSPLYLGYDGPLEFHERYPFCRIITVPSHPELYEMVRQHPAIFPAFYAFPTPAREAKWEVASRMCCRD